MRSRAWNFFFLSFSPVVMVVYKRREKKKTTSPSSSRRRKQILGSRGHFTYNPRQRFTSVARSGGAVFGPSQGRVQQTDYIHQNFAISLLCHRQSLDWISKEKQKNNFHLSVGKKPIKGVLQSLPEMRPGINWPQHPWDTNWRDTRYSTGENQKGWGGDKQGQRRITAPFSTTLNINSSCTQLELDQQTRKKRKRRKKTRFFLSKKSVWL